MLTSQVATRAKVPGNWELKIEQNPFLVKWEGGREGTETPGPKQSVSPSYGVRN